MRRPLIALLSVCAIATARAQDTIRVGNNAPAWGTKVGLKQLFALGDLNGPPEYALGEIEGFAADQQNRFYTFDYKGNQIRAYDANGKFLRLMGRRGAGPGEYQSLIDLRILSDSVLVVFDMSNARITLFQPSGKFLRSIPQPRIVRALNRGFAADRSGLIYYRVATKVSGPGARNVDVPLERPLPGMTLSHGYALRLNADGSLVDSIPIPPAGAQLSGLNVATGDGGNPNFLPQFHVAVSPNGAAVFGQSSSYRFIIHPATGPVRVVERQWTPVPVGSAERDNWLEFAALFHKRYGDRFGLTYTIPKTKPAFRDLMADQDGRTWVSLYAATERKDAPPRSSGPPGFPTLFWRQNAVYDVLDPAGSYLGRVELPPNSRLLWAQSDRIWTLSTGADDEQRIISYTLTGIKR